MKGFSLYFSLFCQIVFSLEIHSIKADFIQTIEDKPIAYEGKFVATSSNLARWDYIHPLKKVVYINANEVIAYEPMLSQVIIRKIERQIDFIAILKKAKQDASIPNLYHSKIDNIVYRIYFNEKLPERIEYENELGEVIIIALKNVVLDQEIPQEVFKFEIPEGIDVVRE